METRLAEAVKEYHEHPELHARNTFAADIISKWHRFGSLTVKQVEALEQSLARDRDAATPKGEAPEGRQTVTGTVLTLKEKDTAYGLVWKMMVRLVNGSKVWVSVPKGSGVKVGDTITFTATFKRADGDPSFAFGSRPEMAFKATVITEMKPFNAPKLSIPTAPEESEPKGPSVLEQLLAELEG